MKNIMIGIIHTLMKRIEAALGSFAVGWDDMVILEKSHIVTAISRANREIWSPISGTRPPKSTMAS